jgi:FlaA1/EpsC-like NDP-sugar epimerase
VRRFFYAFTIVTLKHSAVYQGMFQLVMSQLVTYYTLKYRPYEQPMDNWIELANEATITVVFLLNQGYLQISRSMSRSQQEDYGLAYIAVIALNLLINAYFFGQNIFRNLVMKKLVPLVLKLKEKLFTKKLKVEDVA